MVYRGWWDLAVGGSSSEGAPWPKKHHAVHLQWCTEPIWRIIGQLQGSLVTVVATNSQSTKACSNLRSYLPTHDAMLWSLAESRLPHQHLRGWVEHQKVSGVNLFQGYIVWITTRQQCPFSNCNCQLCETRFERAANQSERWKRPILAGTEISSPPVMTAMLVYQWFLMATSKKMLGGLSMLFWCIRATHGHDQNEYTVSL